MKEMNEEMVQTNEACYVNNSFYSKYIKRILDFMLSLLTIAILSPLMITIAVIVYIKLGSPVLFKQKRPGKNAKIFTLYKFRTMRDATDANGRKLTDEQRLAVIANEKHENKNVSDAQRITKLGKILRATSLDELPELINILKGEMSIVGPRPLSTIYLPYYNAIEKHRHDVTPGLTGLAQINGRNALSWSERFAYDLEYVHNVSFRKDLYILVCTLGVVFNRKDIKQAEEKPEAFHVVRQRELAADENAVGKAAQLLDEGSR